MSHAILHYTLLQWTIAHQILPLIHNMNEQILILLTSEKRLAMESGT